MRNINFYFPSLDERYLSRGLYVVNRNDSGAYSYFKAEYSRSQPYDFERTMMECEVKSRKKVLLEKLKSRRRKDESVAIPRNSNLFMYFKSEFKGDPFTTDYENNLIVPAESYKKVKTRK